MCVCVCVCVCVCMCVCSRSSSISILHASPCIYRQCYEETYRKKRLTPLVFAYIYKLLYTYVYPYNHTNMCLGGPGRGPGPWEPLGGPRGLRNTDNLEVSWDRPLGIY